MIERFMLCQENVAYSGRLKNVWRNIIMDKYKKQTLKEVIDATKVHIAVIKKNNFTEALADVREGMEISLSKLEYIYNHES